MLEKLRVEAGLNNDKLAMLPINRLNDLKKELDEFRETEELNSFQKWIFSNIYNFKLPETGFEVKSIIIIAVHHPLYANVIINYQGKKHAAMGLVAPEMGAVHAYMSKVAEEEGFKTQEVWELPLKRLAVQSGLATYGRNNVTYVEGLGSCLSYAAFLSDAESEEDNWRPMCHAEICDSCGACIADCPTKAIRSDRFLINNERCLSAINEGEGEFPDWLPKDVHHTLYDCLRCQEKCPMNLKVRDPEEVIQTIEIMEDETEMLLAGKVEKDFSEEFLKRVEPLGLFYWKLSLPRNIRALIER